ncbi:Methionine aminopeptidase 2 [Sphingobacterium spiritivorum]|uniref:Methionine aminopeptidase 2 n=1 Tax=Sphingobacterium spiritivorum TaxID=258 RepID=A0A380BH50_SPHSI|nr:hypothetical protein [Sphingobacterium spiritivorum]SUJ01297.1 Methionine aminopeptidase 2 [Sphingobacterium spiritivorum]
MIISDDKELKKMKAVSMAVAVTLLKMQQYARPGISTQELDEYGGDILREFGARSAPRLTYGFPGIPVSVSIMRSHMEYLHREGFFRMEI